MDVLAYVQRELIPMISFALKEHNKLFRIVNVENATSLNNLLAKVKTGFILILDSVIHDKSMAEYAKTIKAGNPAARILYMIDSETQKTELIDLIQTRTINKALLKPFTAKQLVDVVFEMSDHEKPEETSWFSKKPQKL